MTRGVEATIDLSGSSTIALTSEELATFRNTFADQDDCQSLCVLYFTRALMTPLRVHCSAHNMVPFIAGYSLEVKEQDFSATVLVEWSTAPQSNGSDLVLAVRATLPDGKTWVEGTISFTLIANERDW